MENCLRKCIDRHLCAIQNCLLDTFGEIKRDIYCLLIQVKAKKRPLITKLRSVSICFSIFNPTTDLGQINEADSVLGLSLVIKVGRSQTLVVLWWDHTGTWVGFRIFCKPVFSCFMAFHTSNSGTFKMRQTERGLGKILLLGI